MVLTRCCTLALFLSSVVSFAQVNLSLSSGSAAVGGTVSLNLSLNSTSTPPAALQWSLGYSTTNITSVQVTAGPAATAAGKYITCAMTSLGYTCVLVGLNINMISSGVVAVATFQLSGSSSGSVPIPLTSLIASTAQGTALSASGTGGVINVTSIQSGALSQLTCAAASVTGPAQLSCTVRRNMAASTTMQVALASNNSALTVPPSVTIAAGSDSVAFTATAASVPVDTSVQITAMANGATVGTTVKVLAARLSRTPPSIVSLSPFSGTGSAVLFNAVYSDANGWGDLAKVYLVVNTAAVTAGGCYVEFERAANALRLYNVAGTAWLGPSGIGSGSPLSNGLCTVNAASSSFSGSGTMLTLNLSLTFTPDFSGSQRIFMYALDASRLASDWRLMGNWWPTLSSASVPGVKGFVNRYRLFNPYSRSHLHTTDLNEYNVLGTRGFTQEGTGSRIFNAPVSAGGMQSVPLYRIYQIPGQRHFWTSDRNEYLTLSSATGTWVGEGADGYILPVPTGNAVPLLRWLFRYADPPIHQWTTDTHEASVLVGSGAWISEGVTGYVFPPDGVAVLNSLNTVDPARVGEPTLTAVLNAASLEETTVTPGSLVRLAGYGIGAAAGVRIEGVPARILGSSGNEITVLVPPETRTDGEVALQVDWEGGRSQQAILRAAPASPAIFAADFAGRGQVRMRNADGEDYSAGQPAARGSVVVFEMTGVSPEQSAELSGWVGGFPAEIVSVRPSPDVLGRVEVHMRLPEDAPMGPAVPLMVGVGSSYSQRGVTIAVR